MKQHEMFKELLKIQTEIQEKYPELVKYLEEMPDTLPVDGNHHVHA